MAQAGVEMGRSEPGSRGLVERMKEHKLQARVFAVALPIAAEAAGEPDLGPIGGR